MDNNNNKNAWDLKYHPNWRIYRLFSHRRFSVFLCNRSIFFTKDCVHYYCRLFTQKQHMAGILCVAQLVVKRCSGKNCMKNWIFSVTMFFVILNKIWLHLIENKLFLWQQQFDWDFFISIEFIIFVQFIAVVLNHFENSSIFIAYQMQFDIDVQHITFQSDGNRSNPFYVNFKWYSKPKILKTVIITLEFNCVWHLV